MYKLHLIFFQETLRNSVTNQKLVRREKTVRPQKRKLSELEADDLKIDEQLEELTEMYCPFVRGHYESNIDVPKSKLYEWLRKENQDTPKYHTWQKDKMFRSIVLGKKKHLVQKRMKYSLYTFHGKNNIFIFP